MKIFEIFKRKIENPENTENPLYAKIKEIITTINQSHRYGYNELTGHDLRTGTFKFQPTLIETNAQTHTGKNERALSPKQLSEYISALEKDFKEKGINGFLITVKTDPSYHIEIKFEQ